MLAIDETDDFKKWVRSLHQSAKDKVLIRVKRLSMGNPGDAEPVGKGVSEMRIFFGPGYRVYYLQQGEKVLLLTGGTKATQAKDIKRALALIGED